MLLRVFFYSIEYGFTAYLLNKFNSIHMNAKFKMKKKFNKLIGFENNDEQMVTSLLFSR